MGNGSLRHLAAMAMIALMATTLMYLFSLQQVTDTAAPKIARFVHTALERNLAEESRTTMVVSPARVEDGQRHYVLTFEPSPTIAANERSLDLLVRRAAELVMSELVDGKHQPVVTCVALLPSGEERVTFSATMRIVPEPALPPAQGADGAPDTATAR